MSTRSGRPIRRPPQPPRMQPTVKKQTRTKPIAVQTKSKQRANQDSDDELMPPHMQQQAKVADEDEMKDDEDEENSSEYSDDSSGSDDATMGSSTAASSYISISNSNADSDAPATAADFCWKCGEGGANVELARCGRCKSVFYCGEACQRADWNQHKQHCSTSHLSQYDSSNQDENEKNGVEIEDGNDSSDDDGPLPSYQDSEKAAEEMDADENAWAYSLYDGSDPYMDPDYGDHSGDEHKNDHQPQQARSSVNNSKPVPGKAGSNPKVCQFWRWGFCRFHNQCRYQHPIDAFDTEERPAPPPREFIKVKRQPNTTTTTASATPPAVLTLIEARNIALEKENARLQQQVEQSHKLLATAQQALSKAAQSGQFDVTSQKPQTNKQAARKRRKLADRTRKQQQNYKIGPIPDPPSQQPSSASFARPVQFQPTAAATTTRLPKELRIRKKRDYEATIDSVDLQVTVENNLQRSDSASSIRVKRERKSPKR